MTLNEWLDNSGTAVITVAEKLEVSRATVYYWAKGERLPSRAHVREIEKLTGGAVTLRDWPEVQK